MLVFGVGYRSGQPGQTVNLLAYAYGGSNPPPTTVKSEGGGSRNFAGVAQLARASAFQAEGRGFESRLPLCGDQAAGRLDGPGRSDSSAVERFLGKEEVPGSIPGRSFGAGWPHLPFTALRSGGLVR